MQTLRIDVTKGTLKCGTLILILTLWGALTMTKKGLFFGFLINFIAKFE
jgi:hypothetical protein